MVWHLVALYVLPLGNYNRNILFILIIIIINIINIFINIINININNIINIILLPLTIEKQKKRREAMDLRKERPVTLA